MKKISIIGVSILIAGGIFLSLAGFYYMTYQQTVEDYKRGIGCPDKPGSSCPFPATADFVNYAIIGSVLLPVGGSLRWFSRNADLVLIAIGFALLLLSMPVGDYFVSIHDSSDHTGLFFWFYGMILIGLGLVSSIFIRFVFKRLNLS